MKDTEKSRQQLLAEIAALQQQISALQASVDAGQLTGTMENYFRFRELLEGIPIVTWVSNQAGKMIYISANVEKICGYTAAELVDQKNDLWRERIHPEDKQRFLGAYQRFFSTGSQLKADYRIQRKDGSWVWINDRAITVEKPVGRRFAYGVFQDISESKHVEEALQLYIDRIEILYQINQSILMGQSPAEIARIALRWIRQLIPCYRATVALIDDNVIKVIALSQDGMNDIPVSSSVQPDQISNYWELYEQLKQGQIFVHKYSSNDSFSRMMEGQNIYMTCLVPLVYEGELIGSLNLSWSQPYTLTPVQEDIAREVAAQLSISIRQSQLQEADKRRKKELEILQQISLAMRQARKLDDLYAILFKELSTLFNINMGVVLFPKNNLLACEFVYGPAELDGQICNSIEANSQFNQLILAGQASFEPDRSFELPHISSSALLPLQSEEVILGGVVLLWEKRHEFSEIECRLLITISGVVGIAMHRMKVLETLEARIEDRTRELSALYDVTAVSSRSMNLQEILDESLARILQAMKCDLGIILLADDTGKSLRLTSWQAKDPALLQEILSVQPEFRISQDIFKQKKAMVIADVASHPRAPEFLSMEPGRPFAGVPIRSKDQILGVLSLLGAPGTAYNDEAVSLLLSISDQIGIAIENHRLYEQAREAAVLSERQRLARDLHDSVTQSLYSLNLMAETGQKLLEAGSSPEKIARIFNRLGTTAHNALKEMRLLLYQLRPSALEKEGLVEALRQRLDAVEGRAEIKTTLMADHLPKLHPELEEGLYHIAQEALNNALKHAGSTQTDVSIRCDGEWIVLEIHDNGKGLAVSEQEDNQGMGLVSMNERTRLLGGELAIDSQPEKGTMIRVRVKIQSEVA